MTGSLFFIGTAAELPAALSRRLRLHGIYHSNWSTTPLYAVKLIKNLQTAADQAQLDLLANLLQAQILKTVPAAKTKQAWVLPRPGLIAPWASKALDIFANVHCNLVGNIAAGTLWQGKGLNHTWCYDPMTQALYTSPPDLNNYFAQIKAQGLQYIAGDGASLTSYSRQHGLGLSGAEIAVLADFYQTSQRAASNAELMMFAQANSEHCRHKIFNAQWIVDGKKQNTSLFAAIRATTSNNPTQVLSAYKDNAAVMRGAGVTRLLPDSEHTYQLKQQDLHICLKAETHNHPTAIAPYEGAATGVGGEIRDEAATGLGATPKAGWCGFITANLRLPNLPMPWERPTNLPPHASALDIMLEGPMGGANYGNEFGRPNLIGFFRTLETSLEQKRYAYYKPVMLAGGIASIEATRVKKTGFTAGALLLVLGGPSLRIGLGGGSASSVTQGNNSAEIDFSSVQRDNPEIQRRCQMVIDACCAAVNNPIASIHDIGAGGMANAFPELVHDCSLGAHIRLEQIPCNDSSMSPMDIWCNEAQERYALAVQPEMLDLFAVLCARERCPFAVIGEATSAQRLLVTLGEEAVVDMPMQVLFGSLPRLQMEAHTVPSTPIEQSFPLTLETALLRVLTCPAVASKEFLISIADRSISGMVAGEAMIGPWQTPVGDCGLTLDSPTSVSGQAMALGERTPVAISNPAAATRLAIAEALTNLASCGEVEPAQVILCANWMAAPGMAANNAELHQAVVAASELCQELGIAIPVGKDSLAMRSRFGSGKRAVEAEAPVSLVVSALTQIQDVRQRLTPQILPQGELWHLAPARQDYPLGNSSLAQICDSYGGATPDVAAPELVQLLKLLRQGWSIFSAYHDCSDGGLWACLCEMAFSSRLGLTITCASKEPINHLLHEGIGVVVQVQPDKEQSLIKIAASCPLLRAEKIAAPQGQPRVDLHLAASNKTLSFSLASLLYQWQSVTRSISLLRDDPQQVRCAIAVAENMDERLVESAPFSLLSAPAISTCKPRVAILREQGSNGHRDMAYAFHAVGFEVLDLATQDLREGLDLARVQGLVACGGFSYGDVLGGGVGWAQGVIKNQRVQEQLQQFWHRDSSFTLGICNGCQMLAQLGDFIPTATHFAPPVANSSGRFEGRLTQVRICRSPSVLLAGMEDAQLVAPVAHGYGRFSALSDNSSHLISAVYCHHNGDTALTYPINPNGSSQGIAGLCSADGRVTLLMPHPERRYLAHQCPWQHPQTPAWHSQFSPWFRMLQNALVFVT